MNKNWWRQERHERAVQRRAWRRERRHELVGGLATVGRRLRPAAPLVLVTGLAMYGQVSYAYTSISPPAWSFLLRLALAMAIAVAAESIALYVQWHAHDALLNKHTLTAARQRRASYVIAAGMATVNYSHFAGPSWEPNPAAVCFALFSAVGPWLWGLHTRRAQRVQLSREGQLDSGGAVFSSERYRWFPWRTLGALRWSIDHGVTDPQTAWNAYNAERVTRKAERGLRRARRRPDRANVSNQRQTLDLPAGMQVETPRTLDPAHPTASSPALSAEAPPVAVRLHLARAAEPDAAKARELVAQGASQAELVDKLGLKNRHQARELKKQPERAEELLARWTADT